MSSALVSSALKNSLYSETEHFLLVGSMLAMAVPKLKSEGML